MRTQKEKKMMQTGLNRINRELEIDRFLKAQIKMRIALRVLFSKAERFLIQNNKHFVITSDEDDTKILSSKKDKDKRD